MNLFKLFEKRKSINSNTCRFIVCESHHKWFFIDTLFDQHQYTSFFQLFEKNYFINWTIEMYCLTSEQLSNEEDQILTCCLEDEFLDLLISVWNWVILKKWMSVLCFYDSRHLNRTMIFSWIQVMKKNQQKTIKTHTQWVQSN